MKIVTRTATSILLIVGMTTLAEARRGYGDFNEDLFQHLNLTSEQKRKLKALEKREDKKKDLEGESKEARKKLSEALANNAGEYHLRTLHNTKSRLKLRMADAGFEKLLAIRNVLSPEQRGKFHGLRQEYKMGRKD